MTYVPPFAVIKRKFSTVTLKGEMRVNNSYQEILSIIKMLLLGIPIDEKWYLNKYPDVAEAVSAGTFKSGKHHFVEEGYFEGRQPGMVEVDQNWYLKKYPDIAEGIAKGEIKS